MIDWTQESREISDVSKMRCNLGKCSLIYLDSKSPSETHLMRAVSPSGTAGSRSLEVMLGEKVRQKMGG